MMTFEFLYGLRLLRSPASIDLTFSSNNTMYSSNFSANLNLRLPLFTLHHLIYVNPLQTSQIKLPVQTRPPLFKLIRVKERKNGIKQDLSTNANATSRCGTEEKAKKSFTNRSSSDRFLMSETTKKPEKNNFSLQVVRLKRGATLVF
ncbi:hypothetical protein RYX36_007636 [Vicia faba]